MWQVKLWCRVDSLIIVSVLVKQVQSDHSPGTLVCTVWSVSLSLCGNLNTLLPIKIKALWQSLFAGAQKEQKQH